MIDTDMVCPLRLLHSPCRSSRKARAVNMHNLQLRAQFQALGTRSLRDSVYSNSQDGEKLLGPNDLEQARTVLLRTALGVAASRTDRFLTGYRLQPQPTGSACLGRREE